MAAALVCICIRSGLGTRVGPSGTAVLRASAEITLWSSLSEALAAEAELCHPCGPHCEGTHTIVSADGVRRGSHDPGPPPLAEELEALYPCRWAEYPPEWWPVDPELNEPLADPSHGSGLSERLRNGERVALARALATVPPEIGL